MKKQLIILLIFLSASFYATAQVNSQAIGLRGGGNGVISGGEISYQYGLSNANRLELDFGFRVGSTQSRLFAVGIYHWVWNITDGLNWYIGPGAGVGLYSYDNNAGYLNIALGGQIGIEYDFNTLDIPILLSVDARPMWDFLGDNSGLGWGAALGIRYTWKSYQH